MEPNECVEKGIIRKDLFYRINVIYLKIPELKNRKSDIPILLNHFVKKYSKLLSKRVKGVSKEAEEKLISYDWPGNVRELQHVIEGIMNLKENGHIELEDLPENIKNNNSLTLCQMIDEYERQMIGESMKIWNGNISKTAEYLGVPRQTLQYKIKKYEIK